MSYFTDHLEPCMRNQASRVANLELERHWQADIYEAESAGRGLLIPLWWIPERGLFLISVKCG